MISFAAKFWLTSYPDFSIIKQYVSSSSSIISNLTSRSPVISTYVLSSASFNSISTSASDFVCDKSSSVSSLIKPSSYPGVIFRTGVKIFRNHLAQQRHNNNSSLKTNRLMGENGKFGDKCQFEKNECPYDYNNLPLHLPYLMAGDTLNCIHIRYTCQIIR